MNTLQILDYAQKDKLLNNQFLGVFPVNKLPVVANFPASLIINLDPSYMPGSHWVAMWYALGGKTAEYFDSFGRRPAQGPLCTHLKHNLESSSHVLYNDKSVQNIFSDVCGQYCLYFLYKKARNKDMKDIMSHFGENTKINDEKIALWGNSLFEKENISHCRTRSLIVECQCCVAPQKMQ